MLAPLALLLALGADPAFIPGPAIDRLVEQALVDWNVPGCSLVIVTPQAVVHLKGYGKRESGKDAAVDADTVFPLASCTKAFTTTLAALLADEGRWDWDHPVRKYLPDFRLADPAADALVTLRDLAAHRTGVASHDLLWYRSPFPIDDLVRRLGRLPLSRPFRSEMQYQSVMYMALGLAISRAGGAPWEELLQAKILKPLGIDAVFITTPEASRSKRLASGHRLDRSGRLIAIPWYEQSTPNAAGSLSASARALGPWLRLHLTGGSVDGHTIVSEKRLRETHQPHIVIRPEGLGARYTPASHLVTYGLGWVIQDYRGRLVVQHAGLIDGFRAHITILPKDGFAFAILANREGTRMNLALSNSLIDLLLDLPRRDWTKEFLEVVAEEAEAAKVQQRRDELGRQPNRRPTLDLPSYAGDYEEPAYGTARIRCTEGRLEWIWGPWQLPLEHYAGDTFRLRSDHEQLDRVLVTFVVVAGKATAMKLLGLTFQAR